MMKKIVDIILKIIKIRNKILTNEQSSKTIILNNKMELNVNKIL